MASGHLREGKGACFFCALVLRLICILPVCLVAFALYYICVIYQKKIYITLFYLFYLHFCYYKNFEKNLVLFFCCCGNVYIRHKQHSGVVFTP